MKKLQKTKYMAIGLLISLSLALTSTAIAATTTRTLQATFSGIKLIVDGNAVTPRDGNGNVVEPFIVDGTTYLPVRAIGEALGKEVSWDGATNTVYIGARSGATGEISTPATTGATAKLSDLDYLAQTRVGQWTSGESQANTGDYLPDSIQLRASGTGPWTQDYLLDGEYTRITGSVFLGYASRSIKSSYMFQIWGDGVLIYSSDKITAGFLPQALDVDINGVKVLKIGFSVAEGWPEIGPIFGISNTTLYNK